MNLSQKDITMTKTKINKIKHKRFKIIKQKIKDKSPKRCNICGSIDIFDDICLHCKTKIDNE